ncbi:hypothetical protein KEM09_21350 [Carboxylicivirga mesophila]|uniref:DUF1700 domain-containing protein n=1 Tax=Carboxylicivirga mesophila TaxID=1166478 RepID=A0ABS5KFW9_9BACT|nr:hypothetical protein [Carboxylicivirga mesophila]MBS2213969.1 hypothetical protein [Carboxylicivirga mesophila]
MPGSTDKLKTLDNSKLMDVVKNYKQYGYDLEIRQAAITILEERGISTQDLKMTGNFENTRFEEASRYFDSFFRSSKLALIAYCAVIAFNLLPGFIAEIAPSILTLVVIGSWLSLIIYFVFIIKSLLDHNRLYKLIGNNYNTNGTIMYYILGAPLYFIFYFVFKKQVYNEMRTIQ